MFEHCRISRVESKDLPTPAAVDECRRWRTVLIEHQPFGVGGGNRAPVDGQEGGRPDAGDAARRTDVGGDGLHRFGPRRVRAIPDPNLGLPAIIDLNHFYVVGGCQCEVLSDDAG